MKSTIDFAFCKTYTLVAQTPMIHFQYDQCGATLRPSEVKPKLDRYLRSLKKHIPTNWLISGDHDALNYRMQIQAAEPHPQADTITVRDCKAYFGNQGAEHPKALVFRNCELRIICMIPELMALIDDHIGAFFILQNFGTRQSKGFGGFLVEGRASRQLIEKTLTQAVPYYFYADFEANTSIKARLNHAMVVYACMKNGFNMGAKKFEGYISEAFLDSGIGNDQHFFRDHMVKGFPKKYETYQFVRILLGMADRYPYPKRRTAIQVLHFQGTTVTDGKLSVPLESIREQQGIKRFRSPVQIKIFEDRMYFLFGDDCHDVLGQIFLVMDDRQWKTVSQLIKNKNYSQAQMLLQQAKFIATPDVLDRDAFMGKFVAYFNNKRHKLLDFPPDWKPTARLELKEGGN